MYVSLLTMKDHHEIYNRKYNLPNRGTGEYIEKITSERSITKTQQVKCLHHICYTGNGLE